MTKIPTPQASINETLSDTLRSLKRLAMVYLEDLSPTIKRGVAYACAAASLWMAGIFLVVLAIRDAVLENRETAMWCAGIAAAMLVLASLLIAKVVRMLVPGSSSESPVLPSRSSPAHSL